VIPDPVPALVTLDVWGVRGLGIPAALSRMALDRPALRRTRGLRFAKLLGTGSGRTFTVRDADPRHWALLTTWASAADRERFDDSALVAGWHRRAVEHWRADLEPLAARGQWSGREPFGNPRPERHQATGPVAALTRARLVPWQAATFWRAVPPVSADLHRSPGLRFALGIGEAPVGLQGTFSVWRDAEALRAFAYESPDHRRVVGETERRGWYAEELFARFRVRSAAGRYDGRDPLG
jgi:heme-degrading monooxygenase HmoA